MGLLILWGLLYFVFSERDYNGVFYEWEGYVERFFCVLKSFFMKKKKIFNLLKIDSFKSLLKFVLMLFLKIINFVDFMDYVCVLK